MLGVKSYTTTAKQLLQSPCWVEGRLKGRDVRDTYHFGLKTENPSLECRKASAESQGSLCLCLRWMPCKSLAYIMRTHAPLEGLEKAKLVLESWNYLYGYAQGVFEGIFLSDTAADG